MPVLGNRVKDVTTTTGTGALTLAGTPPTGYVSFATALGAVAVSNVPVLIVGSTGEWEAGYCTFNGTTGLTRDTVENSSNAGALVNFSAGSKDVYLDVTAKAMRNGFTGRNIAMMALPI